MLGLLYALLVLLNIGGIVTVMFDVAAGNGRWFASLVAVLLLDVIGFYLLRLARED